MKAQSQLLWMQYAFMLKIVWTIIFDVDLLVSFAVKYGTDISVSNGPVFILKSRSQARENDLTARRKVSPPLVFFSIIHLNTEKNGLD